MRRTFSALTVLIGFSLACSGEIGTAEEGIAVSGDAEAAPLTGQPVSTAPASAAPAAGVASIEGVCQRDNACGCPAEESDAQCQEAWTMLTSLIGPPSSLGCFARLSCAEFCNMGGTSAGQACVAAFTADTQAAELAVMRDYEAQSAQQRRNHETQMGIIENMGATCPSGARMLNGECVYY